MFAYENLFNVPLDDIETAASQVVNEGWRLSHYPLVSLAEPMPWDDDTPDHRSWNYHLHCLDMVNVLLLAHSTTGNVHWLRHALGVAMDWVEKHPYQQRAEQSRFAWYDMAVGKRAYRLAYIADAARRFDILEERELDILWESLQQHADYLSQDENIVFHNNHGLYQAAGQLALGRRFRDVDVGMARAYEQGQERFSRMLASQFTEEGVHREHSPAYHRMVCESLKGVLDAGLVDDPAIERQMLLIESNLAWFVMPNGRLANFGDSDRRLMLELPQQAILNWRTPEMIAGCSMGEAGKAPGAAVKVFGASGYFIARNRWPESMSDAPACSYLAQAAGFHSRTHRHADDLGFIWHEYGSDILVDAGRYGYIGKTKKYSDLWNEGFWYANPYRMYCESTRAHNTVEVDGRNNPRRGVAPYGSAIRRHGRVSGGVIFCETEIKFFKSIRFARVLVFLPGKWLLVFDWLHDNVDAVHDYRQWFHLGSDLTLERVDDGEYVSQLPQGGQTLRVASLLGGVVAGQPCRGQKEPSIQGFYSPSERKVIPNWAFAFEQAGKRSTVFATVLAFAGKLQTDHDWSKSNASGRKARLRWSDDTHVHTVMLERPAEGDMVVSYKARLQQPLPQESSPDTSMLSGDGIG